MEDVKRVVGVIKESVPEDKKGLVDELLVHTQQSMQGDGGMKSMKSKPDYKFVNPFNSEVIEWAYDNWSPNKGDFLVASYPKTGTTWLREVVRQINYFGDEKNESKSTDGGSVYELSGSWFKGEIRGGGLSTDEKSSLGDPCHS